MALGHRSDVFWGVALRCFVPNSDTLTRISGYYPEMPEIPETTIAHRQPGSRGTVATPPRLAARPSCMGGCGLGVD